ncbi:LysR family transcriptional regulator [Paenibacillus sp. HJGM_3]|uniref:LysR family transcriptional regulator n=1 Tax=Paenibacillus sp. HJGM_3 TaxID=3379816 RepID=UPI00385A3A0D
MTITQLIVFVKAAELGSFTKAAQALNMTQPAVSHAISGLESELGLKLLIRDRRTGLALTDAGKRILVHAREIMCRFEHIEQEARAGRGLEDGTVRIGSFPSVSAHYLPGIIGTFRRKHPKVELVLLEGTYEEVEEWIASRVVDIGIVVLPNEEFEVQQLTANEMVVVLPHDHPLCDKSAVPVTCLDRLPFIIQKGYEAPILSLFQQAGVQPSFDYQFLHTSTILKMIEEGLGVAILADLALPDALPNVQIRKLDPPFWRELGLACPSFKECSPAVKRFVQLFLEHVPVRCHD